MVISTLKKEGESIYNLTSIMGGEYLLCGLDEGIIMIIEVPGKNKNFRET
jgi:hypothetical protein